MELELERLDFVEQFFPDFISDIDHFALASRPLPRVSSTHSLNPPRL
jgi:hypothetical protein